MLCNFSQRSRPWSSVLSPRAPNPSPCLPEFRAQHRRLGKRLGALRHTQAIQFVPSNVEDHAIASPLDRIELRYATMDGMCEELREVERERSATNGATKWVELEGYRGGTESVQWKNLGVFPYLRYGIRVVRAFFASECHGIREERCGRLVAQLLPAKSKYGRNDRIRFTNRMPVQ
jgi:hypothetical protein